jgi:hypothetical protein
MSEHERSAAVSDEAAEPTDAPAATPSKPAADGADPVGRDATAEAPDQDPTAGSSGRSDAIAPSDRGAAVDEPVDSGTAASDARTAAAMSPGAVNTWDPFAPDDDDDDERWAANPTDGAGNESPASPSRTADAGDGGDAAGATRPIWASGAAKADNDAAADRPAADSSSRSTFLRPRNLVLISLGVVLLLVIGIFGPTAWEVWAERDVHIATPARINSLELDDSQGAHDTVDYMQNAIKTSVTLDRTTGAVYAESSGDSKSVVFVGGTGTLVTPNEALDKSFGLITDEAGGVDGVHEVEAGPLGGTMKCGTTTTDGNGMAVCGWADHGSLGIAMFPNRKVDESAELLRTMRKAMQTRS